MIKVSARAIIPLKADKINLPEWFYTFSQEDFQKSSPSNLELGFSKNQDGKRVFTNKVAVAGHLLINRYTEDKAAPNFLKMTSSNSRLLLFHFLPFSITVIYELSLKPLDDDQGSPNYAQLSCTSSGVYPVWLEIISKLTLAGFFLQKHQEEETNYFGQDILKKFSQS